MVNLTREFLNEQDHQRLQEKITNLATANRRLGAALATRETHQFFVEEIPAGDQFILDNLGVTPTGKVLQENTLDGQTTTIMETYTPGAVIKQITHVGQDGKQRLDSRSIKVLDDTTYHTNLKTKGFT